MKSTALALLVASTQAISMNHPVNPTTLHWNEDPHSVPTPVSGVDYMTSTQARHKADNYTGHIEAAEPKGVHPQFAMGPYNAQDKEYIAMRASQESESESDSESSSDSDSDSDEENVQIKWHVAPDFGELDPNVVGREKDIKNGEKESGWTNPLGWTDDGHDDDLVVTQLRSEIRYDESEGPTMVDFGDSDPNVVLRESDIKNGEKESGWTNPLGWADTGADDEAVI
eukprot:CAMPEP_0170492822 /NCGR_PEP_ID=MMETSP0208-20121228/12930_1 /TAXON_ID=197538 /ORGANISM="Strombidium inclinatum, Strain S3" /LENGTH=226 /DNA_ID=CAMNT_0010768639 /DNA_START=1 /DNA_END=681 /DNA_ORIENTATION=-